MKLSSRVATALFAGLLMFLVLLGPISAFSTSAQVTQERIDAQQLTVQEHMVDTLGAYVVLLQLTIIQRLEVRVAQMEAELSMQ